MESVIAIPAETQRVTERSTAVTIPWHGWVAVAGVACLPIGLLWDISWHSTIGRDTFWTPAHLVIQLGGLVPGLLFAWLAFKTTFRGTESERAAAVNIWGARAPLGAWLTMWGAAMMVISAPFDDWWHNTYGLDVQIVSPPHSVLGTGMLAVTTGVLLFVFSRQNGTRGNQQWTPALLCALASGVMLTLCSDFMTEFTFPNQQRSAKFYMIASAVYPMALVLTARASRLRWPATIAAAFYMGVLMLMIWILPLFPATPKLAPIYRPVDHMVPPSFPVLLILPALGIDLIMRRAARLRGANRDATPSSRKGWQDWLLAVALGAVFIAIFAPVQWNFSAFLLSDAADNWFFARDGHWPYFSRVGEWANQFWHSWSSPANTRSFAMAFVIAVVSSRIGLWWGSYLLRVRR